MLAHLLSTGEQQAAALVTIVANRAGIPCTLLDPASIGMRLAGDCFDAMPVAVDPKAMLSALAKTPVVVLPSFAGCHEAGGTADMGRGGSDLTAVFLADQFQATCRLVKDVPGIYEFDPATTLNDSDQASPRRYGTITYDDAQAVAEMLVQPKAVEYLQRTDNRALVSALSHKDGTVIGTPTSTFADPRPITPQRIMLTGLDGVGQSVYQLLSALPEFFEVIGIADDDASEPNAQPTPKSLIDHGVEPLEECDHDVLVDTDSDPDAALMAIRRAFQNGIPAVTVGAELMIEHNATLRQPAHENNVRILTSATSTGREGWWPAAEAIIADLMELRANVCRSAQMAARSAATLQEHTYRRPPRGDSE